MSKTVVVQDKKENGDETENNNKRPSRSKTKNKYESDHLESQPPIDYSFKNLNKLSELKNERPRSTRVGKSPKRSSNHRFLTASIWLNNNNVTSINDIDVLIEKLLENPQRIGWLDLSFNNITEIDSSILKYPSLKIFYLHGNNIRCLDTVQKLKNMPNLRSLTLHGNPIEGLPEYRSYVVHSLPQITTLDFSPITPLERAAPPPVGWNKKDRK